MFEWKTKEDFLHVPYSTTHKSKQGCSCQLHRSDNILVLCLTTSPPPA